MLNQRSLSSLFSIIFVTLLGLMFSSASSASQPAIAVDYLIGEGSVDGVRLGFRPHHTTLNNLPLLGDVDVYWEVSLNYWNDGDSDVDDTNYAIALSPVFTKQFATVFNNPIRWEAGIGVSVLEDSMFGGEDLGTHFQFEDRIGVSMAFGEKHDQLIALRYMHYSNGGLDSINPGIDFFSLAYSTHF
ncbi:acyloxyacyl hydrolase [Alteromonas sp. a30]|uniref:acyloxyacyl hydrolase n=1 Tax=Alteromonas sp. a30 TaxID=2730917 RepID=UPI00228197EB|nr:acyloxyacyl hydrolase [Alteromonas sp. a30]MCY7295904.1 acyloxyacyl hydrolase [Alteromonas sp. a30]